MSGNSPRSLLLHSPQTDPRGEYIAWRILRSETLEGPAGWSFDPSAEGAMTTARPPLTLLIYLSLSLPPVNGLLSQPVFSHTPPL